MSYAGRTPAHLHQPPRVQRLDIILNVLHVQSALNSNGKGKSQVFASLAHRETVDMYVKTALLYEKLRLPGAPVHIVVD